LAEEATSGCLLPVDYLLRIFVDKCGFVGIHC
jgi:hypothetical protein